MKKTFALIALVLMSNMIHAQKNNWFRLYDDSTALVKDGNTIKDKFIGDIKKINPAIAFNVPVILNTTPALIYYNDQVVNLPLWTQVIPGIREWMGQIAGGNSRAEDFSDYSLTGFTCRTSWGTRSSMWLRGQQKALTKTNILPIPLRCCGGENKEKIRN